MVSLNYPPPEGFLEAETRCGHYISKQMKEVWAVELDLAKKLLEVCKKYNLKIYADYGTLLGAIRHKGFIPWDDDMDFCMLREDYEKLSEIAQKEFKEPYCLENYENPELSQLMIGMRLHNSNTTAIAKSEQKRPNLNYNQGIFVDIFTLDNVPENKNVLFIHRKFVALYRFLTWGFAYFSTRYFDSKHLMVRYPKKILYILFRKPLGNLSKFFFKKWIKESKKYRLHNTIKLTDQNHVVNPTLREKKDYINTSEIQFEYISIPIPGGSDNILKAEYGNYRIPKKFSSTGELRMGGIFFDTDKPYTDYSPQKDRNKIITIKQAP